MAIDAKFTRTLPAPTATISNGFVFLLSAGWFTDADLGVAGSPIDGGVNSIANGGGDMQIFSDTAATTRLPIEVVSFVTGGTPEAQVWVRTPSYTSGDTITIGRDDTQTIQPAVGAAFGRNATWVDCAVASHTTLDDSTGGATVTETGSVTPVTGVFGNSGGGGSNSGSGDYVTFTGISVSSEWTIMAWVDTEWSNSRFACLGQIGSTGNQANLGLNGSANAYYDRNGTDPVSANTYNVGSSYEFFAARESSALNNLLWIGDGTDSTTTTYDSSFPTLDRARIFKSADDTPFGANGILVSEVFIYTIGLTDDHIASIRDNQSDPDNFGISSEWVLVGGGGISITGNAVNYSLSTISGSIDLTGSIDVAGQSPNYNYLAIAGGIDLTGEVIVIGSTPNYPYASLGGAIDLTGAINIIGATASYNYQGINGSVELVALISIVGQAPNYNYSNVNGDVNLTGDIAITGTTPGYSFSAINGFIVIGDEQTIGVVTAGFAPEQINVKYKLSGVKVNFKE